MCEPPAKSGDLILCDNSVPGWPDCNIPEQCTLSQEELSDLQERHKWVCFIPPENRHFVLCQLYEEEKVNKNKECQSINDTKKAWQQLVENAKKTLDRLHPRRC